ncbi:MAG: hypothetical protein KDF60_20615, partial [Calditrichaeota bacterium]|nr:hypothetical protein [Calditrichota bacterium]
DLDVVDEFSKSEFEKQSHLFIDTLDGQTEKAVKRVDGLWIPKSQMRCDFDGNLYVANWLAAKL